MVNNFGLFFRRDDLVIRLPVNPEELPEEREAEHGQYNVLGIGPILVPRTPSLKVVTISSFFPGRIFPGVLTSGGFKEPEFYINFFEGAMRDKVPILYTPVRYYEDGTPFQTQDMGFEVLVTQFNTEERSGETGDFYYNLTLTEYRDYQPQEVKLLQNGSSAESDGSSTAAVEPSRSIPKGQLYVGRTCTVNGRYYYSSYGEQPSADGAGRRVVIFRIVDLSRPYPYHINTESGGPLGWTSGESLQVVE